MDVNLRQLLKEKMEKQKKEGPGKIMNISDAVSRFVRPQMTIQLGNGLAVPTATFLEITRQFWGKNPGFTLIGIGGGVYNFAVFVHGKLCKKIIAAFAGDGYPFPSPNNILTSAIGDGTVHVEYWTQLTISLRLMAGAMGVPFFPTKSIAGSSLQTENKDAFLSIPNPFGEGESANVVRALNPDIAIAHGWAADEDGNTIIAAPYSGNYYGALAAKEGAIVSVEKIVDADFIRRHSHMTRIPGYVVRAVCEAPLGGHPMGLHPCGVSGVEGYAEDEEFILEARRASKNAASYQEWLDKWVLGCRDHDEYLSRLGKERIWSLKGKIQNDSWTSALDEFASGLSSPDQPTPAELMVTAAAAKLREIIRQKEYKLALCGIGVSNLAPWLAYYDLRRKGYHLELVAEVGYYGYSPQPSDPYVFSLRNIPSCSMITDTFTALALIMCGAGASSIAILGAGQIDRFGNINTTRLSPTGPFLVGSGGANDVASGASECLVTLEQNKERFVDKVHYITSPGLKVSTVVSQLGIMEKALGENELELTAYFPTTAKTEEECVQNIRRQCGWNLKVRHPLTAIPPPSFDDVKFLRCFDPRRMFLGGGEKSR